MTADLDAELLRRLAGLADGDDVIPAVPGPGPHPLSPAQQRLWYLHEVDPDSVEYNVIRVLELTGPLDVPALRAGLDGLVSLHPALRTVFDAVDGQATQTITDGGPADFAVLDAVHDRDALLAAEATTAFDLRRGPLCRFRLLRLAPERHLLTLSAHHIVVDGWSLDVLVRDLAALYGGERPSAPSIRHVDVAAWQRDVLAGGELRGQADHWRARLAGLEPTDLPADFVRPPMRTAAGALHVFEVPADITARLRAIARAERVTLFALLVAAAHVLLARWTGRGDVAVVTAVAERGRPETDDVVGFLVNTLVLRGAVDESRPFRELLPATRDEVLDAFDHRDLPFQQVVEVVRPERDPSRPPLAEVSIALHAAPAETVFAPGLTAVPARPPVLTSSMDLAFDLVDLGETLEGQLTFSTDLFTPATAARLATHLVALLTAVTRWPDRPVAELAAMAAGEHRLLTVEWPVTGQGVSARGVAELFADQVRRAPSAAAVVSDEGVLTYAELDAKAAALAGHLRARGAGPEVLVALALPKSVDLVVAVLAVFRTGAAYLPLDQDSPAERLRTIVENARPLLAVTSAATVHGLPADLAVLDLDEPAEATPELGEPVPVRPDHAAYVIHTSGSTGRPKGVVVTHSGIAGLVAAQSAHFRTGPGSRVLLFASFGFDAAFSELGMALLTGGAVVLGGPDDLLPGRPLADLVARHAVTHLTLPPSALAALPEDAFPPELTLVVAGEACPPATAAAWSARHRMINAYGPTEATVCATMSDPLTPTGGVPMGTPMAGVRVLVLDGRLRTAPIGVPGEVHLAGGHLARGYLGLPGTTAERFVANPYGGPGERMYRSGDRARWRPDGTLEYLGRVDDQVKLRGYRIEPGEVEAALVRHPAVAAAAVVVHQDALGTRRLVAYAVTDPATAADLRRHTRELLPEHMVPSLVVPLDALPVNVNGKVDRAALPDPLPRRAGTARTAPRTAAEHTLARIWSELLGVPDIGVEDNFFDLGGDSILGLRVVARARDAGLLLTAKQTFLRQTVADLAAEAVPLREAAPVARPVTGAVPLTPILRWFFDALGESVDRFNQSMLLELADDVAEPALRVAVDALLAHHDVLRLRATRTGDRWSLWHSDDARARFEVVHLTGTHDEVESAVQSIAVETQQGFDLAAGPLVRVVLFRISGRPSRLLLVAHHLVVDGVSWRVLLADLETGYRQVLLGDPVDLGAKSTSFQDWAVRLADLPVPAGEARYWAEVDALEASPLPVDADGTNTAADLRTVTVEVDAATTRALLRDVPAAYRTRIDDVLLAALGRALTGWTGNDTALVALEGHGREDLFDDVDLSRTVGWFTAVYPVAITVPDAAGWDEVLKDVKEQVRAVPRAGIGHGVLRGPGAAAPEVSFNYLGRLDASESASSLYLGVLPVQGAEWAPGQQRGHALEINGVLTGGKLVFDWSYSRARHHRATVERVATAFTSALAEIAGHCAGPDAGGATPSDFPLVRLDQAGVDRVVGRGPAARDVVDVYPLTPTQSGMLFHALTEASRDIYTGHFHVRLDGVPDPERLAEAWQRVVDRTPALRTSVVWRDLPEPVQVVHAAVRLPVEHDDLRPLGDADRRAALDALWDQQRRTRIDLALAPLLRLRIARVSDTAVELFWSSHHLAVDGWSFAHVLADVLAVHAGDDAPVRPPYRDHVAWLLGRDPAAAERHWRAVVGDLTAPTPLPFDRRPTGAHATRSSRELSTRLSAERSRSLRDAANGLRITLNTLVQGAWAVLLSRHGGVDDVCFGATTSGRAAGPRGVEDIIGLFINTVPVRVAVDPDRSSAEWLLDLQAAQVDGRDHEHVALAHIQRWSAVPPGSGLFDSIVVFENYPLDDTAEGVRVGAPVGDEHTNYALTLTAYLRDDHLHLALGHDPRLFDEDTVLRLLGHLETVLAGLATAPERPLGRVPLMTDAEERQVVEGWNDTAEDFADPAPLHHLYARQAAATPDLVVVRAGADAMTYAELDERANRLAHRLVGLGVGPGKIVGVCADRGVAVVSALLAVLKAGAAFVPMDPEHPVGRLHEVLADSGASVLVTERRLASLFDGRAATVVHLDDPLDGLPATPPEVRMSPEDLAYLCYTSGTTGTPKGVMVEHRHAHHMARAWDARHGLTGTSPIVLSVSSLSVDLFFADFMLAALFGGRLVVCPREQVADQVALADLLVESGATLMVTVPALARAVAAEFSWRGEPPTALRLLMVGSEGWTVDSGKEVLAGFAPGTAVVNAYGSTETTVDSTAFRLDLGPLGDAAHVPVGTPLANTWIAVLDDRLRPVPVGATGECYIGGDGVSRGYRGRAGLTASRFVADPRGRAPGARMYRTGDLARWRADGNLECLGRVDDQVKVRGFRVELGEVESALARHPGVATAAAVLRHGGSGPARLVAYVVHAAGPVDPAELREFAAALLPPAAVPAAVVAIDVLPLTAGGTVDRRALPDPGDVVATSVPHVPPRTPAEALLAEIWAEVLGVRRVGVLDGFFALGGDSILSIRVISGIRSVFGAAISPRQLFDTPTIAGLAPAVAGSSPEAAPVPARVGTGPAPLSSAQARLWFLADFDPDGSEYAIVTALRLRGELDVAALRTAVDAVVARHEPLRTVYESVDGLPVQVVQAPATVPLPVVEATEEGMLAHVAERTSLPFDLRRGPVLRASLVRLSPTEHVLALVAHHIAVDGWSTDLMTAELATWYAAATRGDQADLEDLPLTYGDYAAWEHARPSAAGHWVERLAGITPLALPTDRPRPPVREPDGAMLLVAIDPEVLIGVRALARRSDATLFMTLVAAVTTLLARWCGQRDIVVGTPTSGRTRPELEGLVGLFVNTVPLRSEVDLGRGFVEHLAAVRETVLDAFVHEVPFDRVVEALRPQRDPSRNAVVEVVVGLETDRTGVPGLPGLDVEQLTLVPPHVSHDLSFDFVERDGGLEVAIGYATALFDPSTARSMADDLGSLLAAIVADPAVPLAEVALATAVASPDQPLEAGVAVGFVPPRSDAERTLAQVWAEVLDVDRVGVEDNFFDLGGDSLLSMQAVQRARRAGLAVTTRDLFVHQTVAGLAAAAERAAPAAAHLPAVESAPLAPSQAAFLAADPVAPHHFTQSVLVELRPEVAEGALADGVAALVVHHDALRTRFDGERQRIAAAEGAELWRRHDLSHLAAPERAAAVARLAAEADASLDLAEGPLLRALLFDLGDTRQLFLTVHHLVVDAVSWQILLADLETATAGDDLGPPPPSFARWSQRLADHAAAGGFDDEAEHWAGLPRPAPLPRDGDGPNLVRATRAAAVELDEADTEVLLRRATGVFRARADHVLLAALARTLARWTGEPRVVVDLEGHGRGHLFDDLDVSRTVGWFTAVHPVALDVADPDDWPALVRSVRARLREVPGDGIGHGVLRGRSGAEVVFNYHGREAGGASGLLQRVLPPTGRERDPDAHGDHLLEVVGIVRDGRLRFEWYHSVDIHHESTVRALAEDFRDALRTLAEQVRRG